MKKIETTNIAGTQDAPFIKSTFDHLNEANQNATSDIIKGLLGTYVTNDVIILYGCVVVDTIPGSSSLTAGAVYYNGEIYEVDANAAIITAGLETLVWSIDTTYRAGDPIQWSDGVSRNLHQIDKFVLSAGLSGSGLANFDGTTVKNLIKTDWITPAGVVAGDIASTTLRYRKDSFGQVHFSGSITFDASVGAQTATIFTLPAGYRPSQTERFTIGISTIGSGAFTGEVTINTSGTVVYVLQFPGADFNSLAIYLSSIKFFVD